jgi:hypothetical protein
MVGLPPRLGAVLPLKAVVVYKEG